MVLLRCGGLWRERLVPPAAGTAEAPIAFDSYGDGAPPIISGADLVITWTQAGPLVWQAPCPAEPFVVAFNGAAGTRQARWRRSALPAPATGPGRAAC